MTDVFRSPKLTLNRARHHIDDFNAVVIAFAKSRPSAEIVDKDTKPGYEIHKIVFTRELPETLSCILFDATNNLRAVLDQCGYTSALCSGSKTFKGIKFPFSSDAAEFANHIKGYGLDLPAQVKALFDGYQAYERGNPTLWAVNKIANAKKHFGLIPLPISSPYATFIADVGPEGWVGHDGKVDERGFFRGWDPIKREITLATVLSGHDPHIQGHIGVQVAIEEIYALIALVVGKGLDRGLRG